MITAVAVAVAGPVIPGTICYLRSPTLPNGFLFAITNNDGYALWPEVPVPFSGVLQLAGGAAPYGPNGNGEPLSIPAASDVTVRVGVSSSNPQDIQLPAAVPFV